MKTLLDDVKFINQKDPNDLIGSFLSTIDSLQKEAWQTTSPTAWNKAKQLALDLQGLAIVLCGTDAKELSTAETIIASNSGTLCLSQLLTDTGQAYLSWSNQPIEKPFKVVLLKSAGLPAESKILIDKHQKLLSGQWPDPIVIEEDLALIEAVSLYLGVLNNGLTKKEDLLKRFNKA